MINNKLKRKTRLNNKFSANDVADVLTIIPSLFFAVPFADAGDKTPIPLPLQPSGSVSYTTGFGSDYSADPEINPNALQVPRVTVNEILYECTLALQQYQVWGTPNFITDAETVDENPFPYSKDAFALFDDGVNGPRIFQSNINTNTQTPVVSTLVQANWRLNDIINSQAVVFNNVTFDTSGGGVIANQIVYWNPGSPGKYSLALANGAAPQNALGFADVANSRVIAFGIVPGFSGLTPGAVYYLSTTSAGAITATKPASNVVQVGIARDASTLFVNIQAEIPGSFLPVGTMLDYAGGTVPPGYLICAGQAISRTTYAALFSAISTTWGIGDGSSTFNVPQCARAGTIGSGGVQVSGPATTVGSTYSAQVQAIPTSALPAHVHPIIDPGHNHDVTDPGHTHVIPLDLIAGNPTGPFSQPAGIEVEYAGPTFTDINVTHITVDVHESDITVDSEGDGDATLPTYGPSIVVTKIIYTGVF